jgi:hypothetical protein
MRAIVATAYGSPDVLEIRVLSKPTRRSNEILIRIPSDSRNPGTFPVQSNSCPVTESPGPLDRASGEAGDQRIGRASSSRPLGEAASFPDPTRATARRP